jgi:hypothetical protein
MGRFIRVYFSMKPDNTWAKMDLCPAFRNYARWKDHLEIGATFDQLRMKDAVTVDADSYPRRLNAASQLHD